MSIDAYHAPAARKSAARLYQRARPGTRYTVATREAEWLVALAENTYLALSDFKGHRALLITGRAGTGKTRLMLKLAALWEAAGADILAFGPRRPDSPYEMVRTLSDLRPSDPGRRILLLDSEFAPHSQPDYSPYGSDSIFLYNGDRWGPLPGLHVIATARLAYPQVVTSIGSPPGMPRRPLEPWEQPPRHHMAETRAWARMVEDTWGLCASVNIHLENDGSDGSTRAFLSRPGVDVQEFSPTDRDPWRPCPR